MKSGKLVCLPAAAVESQAVAVEQIGLMSDDDDVLEWCIEVAAGIRGRKYIRITEDEIHTPPTK